MILCSLWRCIPRLRAAAETFPETAISVSSILLFVYLGVRAIFYLYPIAATRHCFGRGDDRECADSMRDFEPPSEPILPDVAQPAHQVEKTAPRHYRDWKQRSQIRFGRLTIHLYPS